jgi:hypothetical protein
VLAAASFIWSPSIVVVTADAKSMMSLFVSIAEGSNDILSTAVLAFLGGLGKIILATFGAWIVTKGHITAWGVATMIDIAGLSFYSSDIGARGPVTSSVVAFVVDVPLTDIAFVYATGRIAIGHPSSETAAMALAIDVPSTDIAYVERRTVAAGGFAGKTCCTSWIVAGWHITGTSSVEAALGRSATVCTSSETTAMVLAVDLS